MQGLTATKRPVLISILLLIGIGSGAGLLWCDQVLSRPVVITFPAPGDLSNVEGLKASQTFAVKVNGSAVFVYETLQGWSFFSLAFDNTTVLVEVTVHEKVRDWKVRPAAAGITPHRNGRTFTFTFSKPRKAILQINGPDGLKLLMSLELPEAESPEPDAPGVLYFKPGVHRIGYRYTPPPGIRTIYLAGGAVVEGTLRIARRDNLKIIGRGIFSMGEWPHAAQDGLNLNHNDGLLVNGITVVNSPGWQLAIGGSNWAVIRNVKLLATKGHFNTDGVQTWNQHQVRVEDFFIRADDDSLVLNHGTTNFVARNGMLWNGTNGASFMLGWGGSRDTRGVLFENIDVLENGSCCAGVFATRWGGESQATVADVTYRNIRIENAVRATGLRAAMFDMVIGKNPWNRGTQGTVENLRFENVAFPFGGGVIKGHDRENRYHGITFVNCALGGEPLTSVEQLAIKQSNASGIRVHHGKPSRIMLPLIRLH